MRLLIKGDEWQVPAKGGVDALRKRGDAVSQLSGRPWPLSVGKGDDVIPSPEYKDRLDLLEITWVDWRVDIEMGGFEYFHLESDFWLLIAPQLPWKYDPVPEKLIQRVLEDIKKMREVERARSILHARSMEEPEIVSAPTGDGARRPPGFAR